LRKLLLLTLALLCFGALANADSFTTFATRAQQNPDDFIDWTQLGPDFLISGTTIPSPQLVSTFNGNLALVGKTEPQQEDKCRALRCPAFLFAHQTQTNSGGKCHQVSDRPTILSQRRAVRGPQIRSKDYFPPRYCCALGE
jgi:hypothetical protein